MRVAVALLALLPLTLGAKELPGVELPSKASPDDAGDPGIASVVKRSISDIAARRRSALDKTFMRFGRSDPALTNDRVKLSGGNLMRFGRSKQDGFMRLGKSPGNLMRFGRATGNVMRFGRSNGNLMRFGRGGNNLLRFGRSNGNLMRFGRSNGNLMRFGRSNGNLMRFGRANGNLMRFGRGGNNLMRFGRPDTDFLNYDNDEFLNEDQEENTIDDDTQKQTSGFLRLGRSIKDILGPHEVLDKQNDNFLRLGRSMMEKDDSDEQNSNDQSTDGNSLENGNKNIYFDDKFMHLIKDSTDLPEMDANQAQEDFNVLLQEESRKKRSLFKNIEKPQVDENTDPKVVDCNVSLNARNDAEHQSTANES